VVDLFCNPYYLKLVMLSGPALGMFEMFGRTGPPIFGHPLFSVTYLFSTSKTHLQQTRISKIFRGKTPEPPLLDPPLNTMNRPPVV